MKFSSGMGIKSFLAVVTASSLALLVIQYYRTRDTWGYHALTYTDFFAFVLGLIGRPIVNRFFTPDEAFWNTPQEVPGIKSSVRISRDKNGLPYLSASSREDLCFGQGYLHATERPVQIELLRLIATGKSAAVLGASMTDTDMISRQVLVLQGVTEALKSLPARPVEFALLGHTPSLPFTLLDLAAISTIYSIMLNRGLTRDFVRVHLKEALGDKWKLFDFGYPEGVPPLNAEGTGPSLYDLSGKFRPCMLPWLANWQCFPRCRTTRCGKPVKFPSVELKDTEWAKRGPSAFPEMTEGPSSLNPEFGGPMHDRDPSAKITQERMKQFKEDMQRAEDFYDLKHPRPWTTDGQPEQTNTFNLKMDGSNAWAISGKLTKTGMPLLAGDPHVEVNAPGSAHGLVALLGCPRRFELFLVGGILLAGVYAEAEGVRLTKDVEPNIGVQGRPNPVRHIARYSHHGPLFSDAVPPLRKGIKKNQALVFASVALRAPLPAAWAEKMLFGKSWKDYIEMGQHAQMNEFVCIWATREGAIGASVTGAVPLRPHSPLPQFRNGSDPEQDWKGALPQEQIPFVMNPKNGIIVAGNSVLANDPKRIFGEVFVPGHRVRRAHHLLNELKSKKKIEVEDLIKMQVFFPNSLSRYLRAIFVMLQFLRGNASFVNTEPLELAVCSSFGGLHWGICAWGVLLTAWQEDQFSEHGCEFRDYVLKEFLNRFDLKNDQAEATALCAEQGLTPYVARLLKSAMESWDCSMNASSYGASIYEVWLQMTLQEVFAANNWTDEALFTLVGGWMHPTWLPRTEALNHWRINLLSALKDKNSGLLPAGYPMTRLFCKSSYETLMYLVGRLGPEVKDWNWGKLRSRYIDHLFVRDAPVLRNLLSVGPLKWGGNFGTLKAHHFEPHILKSNDSLSGNFHRGIDTTSLRVVFDLNDWENSRWAYFPGVSGWVGSKHFGDTAEFLEDGKEKLFPMPWDEEKIEASLVANKVLHPKRHKQQPLEQRQKAQRQQDKQEF
ncbi:penicillin amidase domain-containing protein, putative [Eimeria acervulina]|uniref:Penicillin amidase domain-containing protein, putative n=1 Tax=Eimeria acervulina TaxID=5801 RepID=U6GLR6_EIMAC|nr:penicillin amidase domain-containing protein, putative [Eimeria acervulina]CDI79539.1 penicillin amidase domain-containing protein, putative [Eimeria acervulina]